MLLNQVVDAAVVLGQDCGEDAVNALLLLLCLGLHSLLIVCLV